MKPCQCSVCDPSGALELIKSLKTTNRHDFQKLLNQPTVKTNIPDVSILTRSKMLPPAPKDLSRRPLPCFDDDPIREYIHIFKRIIHSISNLILTEETKTLIFIKSLIKPLRQRLLIDKD